MTSRQIPLAVSLRDDATLDNFVAVGAAGEAVVSGLRRLVAQPGPESLFIAGVPGCGRSHLLQAACHLAWAHQLSNAYLPLREIDSGLPAEALDGFEHFALLAVDDLDRIVGKPAWEKAFFHLFNRTREAGQRLLMAADNVPARLGLQLADLQSRLAGGLVFQLPRPGDEDRITILTSRAARRGLDLSPEVARYILQRAPRSLDVLIGLLEELDQASLAEARKLTIPFVKAVFGW